MVETDQILWLLLPLAPALIFSGLAMNFALVVAFPRLRSIAGRSSAPSGLFNAPAVATYEGAAYVDQVLGTTLDQVKREVLHGVHAKAGILMRKFALVRRGILCTVGAFVAWLIFVSVTFFRV